MTCTCTCTCIYIVFLHCSTCNLATQCLRSEFSQQIRAHEFIPKIVSALRDALEHPVRGRREEGGGREGEEEGGGGEGVREEG